MNEEQKFPEIDSKWKKKNPILNREKNNVEIIIKLDLRFSSLLMWNSSLLKNGFEKKNEKIKGNNSP